MNRPLKSSPGCPKTGWQWLRAIDLHDQEGRRFGDYEICEFCGKEQIRFVHYLQHSDWKARAFDVVMQKVHRGR